MYLIKNSASVSKVSKLLWQPLPQSSSLPVVNCAIKNVFLNISNSICLDYSFYLPNIVGLTFAHGGTPLAKKHKNEVESKIPNSWVTFELKSITQYMAAVKYSTCPISFPQFHI